MNFLNSYLLNIALIQNLKLPSKHGNRYFFNCFFFSIKILKFINWFKDNSAVEVFSTVNTLECTCKHFLYHRYGLVMQRLLISEKRRFPFISVLIRHQCINWTFIDPLSLVKDFPESKRSGNRVWLSLTNIKHWWICNSPFDFL